MKQETRLLGTHSYTEDLRPRYWVYEGETLRAAQATFYGALQYWRLGMRITTMPRDAKGLPYDPGY